MRKSTKVISLVLIESGLILSGCDTSSPPGATTAREDTAPSRSHHGYHGGVRVLPVLGGAGTSSGSHSSPGAVSPRGGFGGAGHAVAGG